MANLANFKKVEQLMYESSLVASRYERINVMAQQARTALDTVRMEVYSEMLSPDEAAHLYTASNILEDLKQRTGTYYAHRRMMQVESELIAELSNTEQ